MSWRCAHCPERQTNADWADRCGRCNRYRMKASDRIAAGMEANEDWVLGQISYFGVWQHGLLTRSEHNAIDRLKARGAIKYCRVRGGYVRAGTWAKPGPKNKSRNR